jgi:hypothetical protein
MAKTLEQRVQLHRDGIKRFIGAADDWRAKKNPGWELFCLFHAVEHALGVAVSAYDSPAGGISYLSVECKKPVFDRTFSLVRELHLAKTTPLDGTPPPGVTSLILCVHAAWLLDLKLTATELALVCDDEDRLRYFQMSPFWRDYAKGIKSVAHRMPYVPAPLKYKGYEKHWATYLQLMAAMCASNDLTAACAMVDESFAQRNHDKRLIGDGLDGDGAAPVKWDFRKKSLLSA